jgi:hypothetical protein
MVSIIVAKTKSVCLDQLAERAANAVLDVDQFSFQELPVHQKCAHLLHIDILHMRGPEPARQRIRPRHQTSCQDGNPDTRFLLV